MEPLESIARLSTRVLRVLGQNPGKFTLQGTNTYLIGEAPPYILFDTGDGTGAYIPELEAALLNAGESKIRSAGVNRLVSDIIISHRHHDHHGGLPSVLSLVHRLDTEGLSRGDVPVTSYIPPRIRKLPRPNNGKTASFSISEEKEGKSFESTLGMISQLPPTHFQASTESEFDNGYTGPRPTPVILDLMHGDVIKTESLNPAELQVIHTPGHTSDSTSLLFPEENSLFTADTVLGEGTAVFEDLSAYMASLKLLLDTGRSLISRGKDEKKKLRIYPGHGPVVEDGIHVLETYIKHRSERENQILSLIEASSFGSEASITPPEITRTTIRSIVRTIYAKYPPAIWPAAERGVWLHVEKLEAERKVARVQEEEKQTHEARKLGDEEISAEKEKGEDAHSADPVDEFSQIVDTAWVRI